MSIFDLFRKNKKNVDQPESEIKSEVQEEKKEVQLLTKKRTDINTDLVVRVHPDLEGLIWIGDGKYKNYTSKPNRRYRQDIAGNVFIFEFNEATEPSLIFTRLKISKPENVANVEKLNYFPCYGPNVHVHSELTPEQRWVYLNFLTNPYTPDIDIGYVFLLYYGLERHLLEGDFDKAMAAIIRLRKVHKQKSFQTYSGNAIILASLLKQKGEWAKTFFQSLDNERDDEYIFSHNLYLLGAYSFDIPLSSKDIARMAQTFEFTKRNYIKKYYDLFLKNLDIVLIQKTCKNTVSLKDYINLKEIKKLSVIKESVFINYSIEADVPVTLVQDCFKLKRDMNLFLEAAHELTKLELAELRKRGKIKPEPKKPKKEIYFQENYITAAFMEYKINVRNVDEQKGIIDFDKNYHEYGVMYEDAYNLEKGDIARAIVLYLKILGKTTPNASLCWERPLILLERIKMYKEAYFICQRAAKVAKMPHVSMGDFDLRLARLAKKVETLDNQD